MFSHWAHGIHADFRDAAIRAVEDDSVRLHRYAPALNSSQVFAFNLFIPFREERNDALAEILASVLGAKITVERITFEWVPPGELLGELDGEVPVGDERATAVDIVLWGKLRDETKAVVLLEVKLTEGGFTSCNGASSRGNRRKDVCESAATFFSDPAACYLRRPVRKRRDRRYWQVFANAHGSVRDAFPNAPPDGPCPFIADAQQPMRNLALARALEQAHVVDRAWFGLCAHDENPDVARHWAAWQALLPNEIVAPSIGASRIVAAGRSAGLRDWADWMTDRYQLRSNA